MFAGLVLIARSIWIGFQSNVAWARLGEAERVRRQASEAERGRYEVGTLSTRGLGGTGGGFEGFLVAASSRGIGMPMTAFWP